jgi:hypothetical protein
MTGADLGGQRGTDVSHNKGPADVAALEVA